MPSTKQSKAAAKYFNLQPGWVLHHKDENMKYEDPERYAEWRPEDLVPMTREDHAKLHHKGTKHSEETKHKMSQSHMGIGKGEPTWNKGLTKENDSRLSKIGNHRKKGEPGRVINVPNKGKFCFNNGVVNVYADECPEGFVPGMKPRKRKEDN